MQLFSTSKNNLLSQKTHRLNQPPEHKGKIIASYLFEQDSRKNPE
jgi:hypothetical protein